MAKIDVDIADLESILVNCSQDRTEAELKALMTNLEWLRYVSRVWQSISSAPTRPDGKLAGNLVIPYPHGGRVRRGFTAGTPMADVRLWFEATFRISIQDDLTD